MPSEPGYAIAELASLAGVTPRTVRYYVSVGLLAPPDQAGRGARYSEGHLQRVRLIRRLQEQHLPLAEIRSRLASLSDDEVEQALGVPDPQPVGSALDYIRSLTPDAHPAPPAFSGPPSVAAPTPPPQMPQPTAMWERIPLAPDVELHVRRPLSRTANKRVERLITIAKEILEDPS